MASQRPIVAMRTKSTEAMLGTHEDRGLLVEPGNTTELAAAILRVLNDTDLGRRMAQSARTAAEIEHSWIERVGRILSALPA